MFQAPCVHWQNALNVQLITVLHFWSLGRWLWLNIKLMASTQPPRLSYVLYSIEQSRINHEQVLSSIYAVSYADTAIHK